MEHQEVKVDLSSITDEASKTRILSLVEALNNKAIPPAEFFKRISILTESETDLIIDQNPFMAKAVASRPPAIDPVVAALLTAVIMGGITGKKDLSDLPPPSENDPLRKWIAGFAETGHFINSAAALDFTEQLVAYVRVGYKNPPANPPRKMSAMN